jgi:hypothetical protein
MSESDLPSRLKRYGGNWQVKRIALTGKDTARLPSVEAATKAGDPRIAGSSASTAVVAGSLTP